LRRKYNEDIWGENIFAYIRVHGDKITKLEEIIYDMKDVLYGNHKKYRNNNHIFSVKYDDYEYNINEKDLETLENIENILLNSDKTIFICIYCQEILLM